MRAVAALIMLALAACEASERTCSIAQVCATPAERLGVGVQPGRLAVRDLDGDGRAEWIALSPAQGTLAVAWGGDRSLQTWSIGQDPQDMSSGDVDGDGRVDVAVVAAGDVAVLRGAGSRRSGEIERVEAGERLAAVAAADLDADGAAELVVADAAVGALRVLRRAGEEWVVGPAIAAGEGPAGLAVADFDGDGRVDVAVALAIAGAVKLFLGTGDGTFGSGKVIYAGGGPTRALADDLDGDGALDLALVDGLLDEAVVIRGDGTGGVAEVRRWRVPAGPFDMALWKGAKGQELLVMSDGVVTRIDMAAPEGLRSTPVDGGRGLAAGDLDGDGEAEVFSGAGALRDGPGFGFTRWWQRDAIDLIGPLAADDLDGDGWLDLVVFDRGRGELALLRGREGGFAEPVRSPGPEEVDGLRLADLDGDGRRDVIAWRADPAGPSRLWTALGSGAQFAGPVETELAGAPARVAAFDVDGAGRSGVLVLSAASETPGLLRYERGPTSLALIDHSEPPAGASGIDVVVGDFSPAYAGDELLQLLKIADEPPVLAVESWSGRRTWFSAAMTMDGETLAMSRGDVDGDAVADLLICTTAGLAIAWGLDWHEFTPPVRVGEWGCGGVLPAELDGDGRMDLLMIEDRAGVLSVEARLASPSWLPGWIAGGATTTGNRPEWLVIADFDRDGRPDLAANGDDGLVVLRGGPQAMLRPVAGVAPAVEAVVEVRPADVDGDAIDELVTLGRGGRGVGVGKVDGTGTLGPVRYFMSGFAEEQGEVLATALDSDGDGADELVTVVAGEGGPAEIHSARLSADGVAGARVVGRAELGAASRLRAGDLDGDGRDDLVYLDRHGRLVSHLGEADGLGAARVGPSLQGGDFLLGDLDRDGDLDAVVDGLGDSSLSAVAGDGRGHFSGPAQPWRAGGAAAELLAVGDLDDDGLGDLVLRTYDELAPVVVCRGGSGGPRGECRALELEVEGGQVAALAIADVDGDGVTDALAVVERGVTRWLTFARGGDGGRALSHKPLPPRGDGQALVDGALHEVRLDDGGPEWVFTDREGLVRLGVRGR